MGQLAQLVASRMVWPMIDLEAPMTYPIKKAILG